LDHVQEELLIELGHCFAQNPLGYMNSADFIGMAIDSVGWLFEL
jgi:hypothetical protein